jgi:hypothetical protein
MTNLQSQAETPLFILILIYAVQPEFHGGQVCRKQYFCHLVDTDFLNVCFFRYFIEHMHKVIKRV